MIDLHMHTTASDGRCSPTELVGRLARAGITVFSVTDHDTTAGLVESAAAAVRAGLEFIPGTEITAVYQGRDVHVLGYFIDPTTPELSGLLAASRQSRVIRAREIAARLAALNVPIDVERVLAAGGGAASGIAIARPVLARALVEAGHVSSIREAFDRYLGESKPAYVPRQGRSPSDVVQVIRCAGGVASLAHPGVLGCDELIPQLVDAGLGALEAYHSDHSTAETGRYLGLARQYGLAVTGGSDYHGDGVRRAEWLGIVSLPPDEYRRFCGRARQKRSEDRPPLPEPARNTTELG